MADEPTITEEVREEESSDDVAPLTLDERLAQCEARITELTTRLGEHSHDGYASLEHDHGAAESVAVVEETPIIEESKPEPTHPYFRRAF